MTIPWFILPPDAATNSAEAHHDTGGWTLQAHVQQRPGTSENWLVFDVPDNTPDKNGCWLTILDAKGKPFYQLHGVLFLHEPLGAILGVDIFPLPPKTSTTLPKLSIQGKVFVQDE